MVESFVGETRVLAIEGRPTRFISARRTHALTHGKPGADDQMAEISVPGFEEAQTLFCANVIGDLILQVTPSSVRLIGDKMEFVSDWKPAAGI